MNNTSSTDEEISQLLCNYAARVESSKKLQDQLWDSFHSLESKRLSTKVSSTHRFSLHPKPLDSNSNTDVNDVKLLEPKEVADKYFRAKTSSAKIYENAQNLFLTDESVEFVTEILRKENLCNKNNHGLDVSRLNSAKSNEKKVTFDNGTVKNDTVDADLKNDTIDAGNAKEEKKKVLEVAQKLKNAYKKHSDVGVNVYAFEVYEDRRKMSSMVDKCKDLLSFIRNIIAYDGIRPPDGTEDYIRRRKRSIEFTSRFSRNYLYQLDRFLTEFTSKKKIQTKQSLSQKFLNVQHIILQALAAYHGHLPSSVTRGLPNKLKDLLVRIKHVNELHLQHLNTDELRDLYDEIQEFKEKTNAFQTFIEQNDLFSESGGKMKNEMPLKSPMTMLKAVKRINSQDVPFHKKNSLDSRLSMYGSFSNNTAKNNVKKSIAFLAKKHNLPHSKQFRNKVNASKPKELPPVKSNSSNRSLLAQKNTASDRTLPASNTSSNVSFVAPINEEISTLIGMENETNTDEDSNTVTNNNNEVNLNEIVPLAQELCEKINKIQLEKQGKQMSSEEMDSMIKHLIHTTVSTKSIELKKEKSLQPIQENQVSSHSASNLSKSASSELEIDEKSKRDSDKKIKKRESVTVIGPKSVQLICINADPTKEISFQEETKNYGISPSPKISVQNITVSEKNSKNLTINKNIPEESHQQVEMTESVSRPVLKRKGICANLRINRLPKTVTRTLPHLTKTTVINIVKYNLKFKEYTGSNPIYFHENGLKPWELLGDISEKLMDEVILSITREINVNHILDRIYHSEFQ